MPRPKVKTPTFSLLLRGDFYYIGFWASGRGCRKSTRCFDRAKAEQVMADFAATYRPDDWSFPRPVRTFRPKPPHKGATDATETGQALVELERIRAAATSAYTGPGVYFLLSKGHVSYIGQALNVLARVGGQAASKDFDAWTYVECPVHELLRTERAYIDKFKPLGNVDSTTQKARRLAA